MITTAEKTNTDTKDGFGKSTDFMAEYKLHKKYLKLLKYF